MLSILALSFFRPLVLHDVQVRALWFFFFFFFRQSTVSQITRALGIYYFFFSQQKILFF